MQGKNSVAPGRSGRAVCALLFLILFYLYVWLRIDPRLSYQIQAPPFYLTGRFFSQLLHTQVGGLCEYAAAFLVQFWRFDWAGALIITITAWLIGWNAGALISRIRGKQAVHLPYAAALFVLFAHQDYGYPFSITVGVLAALLAANAFLRLVPRTPLVRAGAFVVLSGLLCAALGGPAVVFAGACAIAEFAEQPRKSRACLLAVFYVLFGTLTPWLLAAWTYDEPTSTTYARLIPREWNASLSIGALTLYAFLLAAALAAVLLRGRWGPDKAGAPKEGPRGKLAFLLRPAAFLVVLAVVVVARFDHDERGLIRMDYLARHEMWPEFLDYVRGHQSNPVFNVLDLGIQHQTILVINDTDRALFHTGRLPYDMFSYPQLGKAPTLTLFDRDFCAKHRQAHLRRAELLFELGRINEAEHMAHEAWEYFGDRPGIFRRIVLVNILKERYDAAHTYLNLLSTMLFERDWAAYYLRALDDNLILSSDPVLQWGRAVMLQSDFVGTTAFGFEDAMLTRLLRDHRHNKMAFEYLMAHYLLADEPAKVVANLGGLDGLNYPDIPRHYEEAALAYMAESGVANINLFGRTIRPETLERFRRFESLRVQYGQDLGRLWDATVAEFGNTFWFYRVFGITGFGKETKPGPYDIVTGAS